MEVPTPLFELPPCTEPPVVGSRVGLPGFQFNLVAMQELGIPRALLQQLADGVRMNFVDQPSEFYKGNHGSASKSPQSRELVHQDLLRLYDLGKLRDLGDVRPAVCNPLGLVLKRDKVRVVLDASISGVNDCMDLIYYGLPTVRDVVQVLTPGCFVAKIDVSDAYLTVPVHPEEAHFFGVEDPVTGRFFQYDFLPFGGRNSGPLFCLVIEQVIEAVKREWLRHGIKARVGSFSDDSWIVAETFAECSAALGIACQVFQRVGMYVKPSKVVAASQVQEVIGVLFDTVNGLITITDDRKQQITRAIEELLSSASPQMEVFETLVGRLGFVQCAVSGLSPHMQQLYPLLPRREPSSLSVHGRGRRTCAPPPLCLSDRSRKGLEAVRDRLTTAPVRYLHVGEDNFYYIWDRHAATSSRAEVEVDLDASGLHGWGVRWMGGDDSRAGRWSQGWLDRHINEKELYCTLISVRWWGKSWCRLGFRRVLIYCDNQTAVGCINKLRSPSSGLGRLCTELNEMCEQLHLELVAVHKPGYLNTVPDQLSRGTLAPWSGDYGLTSCGVADLCRRLHVRGKVRNLNFLELTSRPAPVRGLSGTIAVGFAPHRDAVQTLRELLRLRRLCPGLRVAVCIPIHTFRFISELWGTFRRYYSMRSLWRTGARGVLDLPRLDLDHDDGSRVTLASNPWRVVVLMFKHAPVGPARPVDAAGSLSCAGECRKVEAPSATGHQVGGPPGVLFSRAPENLRGDSLPVHSQSSISCLVCRSAGGDMVKCQRCSSTAHMRCLGLPRNSFMFGQFVCSECRIDAAGIPPDRVSEALAEAGRHRNQIVAKAREPSTLQGYRTGLNHLRRFSQAHGVPVFPMNSDLTEVVFSRLALDGHSISVLGGIRTTVTKHHLALGEPDPFSDPRVEEFWAALKRAYGRPAKHHREFPHSRFVALIEHLIARGRDIDLRDAVAICLGYMGFRRHSEICGRKADLDFERGFRVCDIDTRLPDRVRCFIRRSKVDPVGHGATCVISSRTQSGIDFRALVISLLGRMGISLGEAATCEAPLIQSTGRDGRFTGKRFRMDQRFKLLQRELHGDGAEIFNFHCTRVGGASHAINSGVSSELGKAHGIWDSDAFWIYARSNEFRRLTVTECM